MVTYLETFSVSPSLSISPPHPHPSRLTLFLVMDTLQLGHKCFCEEEEMRFACVIQFRTKKTPSGPQWFAIQVSQIICK